MTELGRHKDRASRRVIDMAIGILIGLRGCSEQEAWDDLVNAVRETGIGPGALARALVDLAGGVRTDESHQTEAVHMWAHLLSARVFSSIDGAD